MGGVRGFGRLTFLPPPEVEADVVPASAPAVGTFVAEVAPLIADKSQYPSARVGPVEPGC